MSSLLRQLLLGLLAATALITARADTTTTADLEAGKTKRDAESQSSTNP